MGRVKKYFTKCIAALLVLVMAGSSAMTVSAADKTYYDKDMFKSANIKGVQGSISTEKFGGIEHNLCNIFIDEIIKSPDSAWAKNGWIEPYEFEGEKFYFNGDYIGYNYIKLSNKAEMSISAVFLLRKNVDRYGCDSSFLIDAGSREDGHLYYAPNSDLSTYGGRAMRAFWHYMMESFAEEGIHVDNFILGNEVNMSPAWHHSGSTQADVVATKYADSFQLMWSGVRAHSSIPRCSISLDHSWQYDYDESDGVSAKKFLKIFNNRLVALNGREIDWCVSTHLYPAQLYDTEIWVDRNDLSPNHEGADFVDGSNLWVMTNYIRDTYGEEHRVMLTEQGFCDEYGAEAQAACLAYSYYAAMYDPMVDCFIINNSNEGTTNTHEGVKSLNFKLDGTLAGEVYTKIGNGNPADEKWIADTCLPVIGVDSWAEIIPNYGNYERKVYVEKIVLNQINIALEIGQTSTLTATVTPSDATNPGITWYSTDESVATVQNGVVTAKKAGNAVIVAKALDGSEVLGACNVSVKQSITGITLNQSSMNMAIGDTYTLWANIVPENASNKTLAWYSSDPSVVSVENGVVTAHNPGYVLVIAKALDGSEVSGGCNITVQQPVTDIVLSDTSLDLELGASYTLQASVEPANASNKNLEWTTSNEDIVTVNANGTVRALCVGEADITVTATDGSGISATCTVTVPDDENNPFADVPTTHWGYSFIQQAVDNGYMAGNKTDDAGNIVFQPDASCWRAHFVQILYNIEGKPPVEFSEVFSDVDEDDWYASAVIWAAQNNITVGKDGRFDPTANVTRAEMATFLYNYAKNCKQWDVEVTNEEALDRFQDLDELADWATPFMKWAVEKNIITGSGEGGNYIKAQESATRAQAATMLNKLLNAYQQ